MIPWDRLALMAAVLAAVGGLAVLLWPRVRHQAIYPGGDLSPDRSDPALHGLPDAEEVWLEAEDGVRIHAWWTPASAAARGAVVYCHGNAESMATRAWIADRLARRGFDVLLFDYRGYGLSGGRASEEGLARDVRAAWRHVVEARGADPGRVVVMGHSLGSAVATRLALELTDGAVDGDAGDGDASGRRNARDVSPAALVVASPFPDMPTLFRHHAPWLPDWALRWRRERLDAGSRLAEVDAPVLVIIGTEDEVIPPRFSRDVHGAARAERPDPGSVRLLTVASEHGTLMGEPEVWDELDSFLADVLNGQSAGD